MEHFNRLTPAEAERLALLMEEMGEAQQIIGKILRHGYESTHPAGGPTNRKLLEEEMGHVLAALFMMSVVNGDLNDAALGDHAEAKTQRVQKYLHHQ